MEKSLGARMIGEFVGLFLMTSIGLMTVATAITSGSYGLFELSMAFAFVVMIIVIVSAAVSDAHINPAVTIALAVFGRFPWREVPGYVAAQLAGGYAGSMVLYALYRSPINAFESANGITRGAPDSAITAMIFHCFAPNPAIAGANKWSMDLIGTPTALAGEAFGTFVLALVLFLMLDHRNAFAPSAKSFALTIGLVVGFIIMVLAPLTMSGINPARDLGPRLATWTLGWGATSFPGVGPDWWVWTVGPIIGALVGGAVALGLGRLIPASTDESANASDGAPALEPTSADLESTPATVPAQATDGADPASRPTTLTTH